MGINSGYKSQNNKIKNETELLEMFTAGDGVRAFTYVPFLHPVYNEVWATDGHVIIRISPDRLNKHYEPVKGCEGLKLSKVLKPCHLFCTYKAIRQALDACPLVDEVITEECNEDCKECVGTGVIMRKKEIHTGKKVHNKNAIVKIGNSFFSWYSLDIVAKALAHIGADVINITANEPCGMTEFVFDGIKIGLMRYYNSEGEGYNAEVELKEKGDEV